MKKRDPKTQEKVDDLKDDIDDKKFYDSLKFWRDSESIMEDDK